MQPNFKDKKVYAAIIIIMLVFGVWLGILLSLPAKKGYTIIQWQTELKAVYMPMLKSNWYGLKNPLWWKKYMNEYTMRFIFGIESLIACVLLYLLYFAGNYIHDKECGTAKFADPYKVNEALRDKDTPPDKLHIEIIKRRWFPFLAVLKKRR